MLYVFYGSDTAAGGSKARDLAESLRAKRPDAAFVKMDADSWDRADLEGHLGGQGLFSGKYIVFLDRLSEDKAAKEALTELAPAMAESPNIFIVLEGKPTVDLKRSLEKSADKAVECEPKAAAPKRDGFNVFGIADLMARHDRTGAWRAYRQAIDSGIEPENVAGILFWKAKSVQSKELAKAVTVMYHDAHRGLLDLELGIEKLLLSW